MQLYMFSCVRGADLVRELKEVLSYVDFLEVVSSSMCEDNMMVVY